MLDAPQITKTADQLTAVIHLTVPRQQIRQVMGPGIGELVATLAAQGVNPAGPWFSHHLRMDLDIFDFEISVPVTTPVVAAGRVQPGLLSAANGSGDVEVNNKPGAGPGFEPRINVVA